MSEVSVMDFPRPGEKSRKRKKRMLYAGAGLLLVVSATATLSRLKPAAPTVDRSTVWIDTVKRGLMLRDARALGTLVPETVWVVPAATDGRVYRRYLLPGTAVKAATVLFELRNPQLEQEVLDAEYQLKGAEAAYEQTKAQLENQLMDKRTFAASVSSQYRTAELLFQTDQQLLAQGLGAEVNAKKSAVAAEELAKENDLAQRQVDTFANSIATQLAVQQATVDQKRAFYKLKKSELDELQVRAGVEGVLQELDVDVGQSVTQGAALARVSQPTHLKAALQIPETQAKDIQLDEKTSIDTHNGIIPGHVMRIDPAVVNGTRTVDVRLDGPLPQGAVPQLTVEGTIEVERLADVLYVGRPVHGDTGDTIGLFALADGGKEAVRLQVQLGRESADTVEIRKGLQAGDQVILSDMSAWDKFDRVELK
jgi:HlyD family secretion protein